MQIDQVGVGVALPTADAVVAAGLTGDFGPALWGTIRDGDMAGPGDLAPKVDAVLGPVLLEGQIQPPLGLYPGTLPGDLGHVPEPPSLWLLLGLLVPVILWRAVRRYRARQAERQLSAAHDAERLSKPLGSDSE